MHLSEKVFTFGVFFLYGITLFSGELFFIGVFGLVIIIWILFLYRKGFFYCIKIFRTFIVIIFLGLFFGYVLWIFNSSCCREGFIDTFNSQDIIFSGKVIDVDRRVDHVKLTIDADHKFISRGEIIPLRGRVLIKTDRFPIYSYGDYLKIDGKILEPSSFDDFDYKKYLERYNIYSVSYDPKIKILSSGKLFNPIRILNNIRIFLEERLGLLAHEPYASFMAGLVIGSRRGIPKELTEAFNATGTTHIIAVSGYNITLVSRILFNFFLFCLIPRQKAFWFVVFGIFGFVIFTGMSASVVRAGCMGFIVLFSRYNGRRYLIRNGIMLAVFVMVFVNPKILIFDIGFQLSCLSTIGLIWLSPVLENFFKWIPARFQLRDSLMGTLSSMIITLPLIIKYFGRFSYVAPIVNMLILPVIPYAMYCGVISLVVSFIYKDFGRYVMYIGFFILKYVIFIVKLFS